MIEKNNDKVKSHDIRDLSEFSITSLLKVYLVMLQIKFNYAFTN